MTIHTWLQQAVAAINSLSPRLDAELLLAESLGKTRAYLFAFADEVIPEEQLTELNTALQRLTEGYPLAYLLGKKDFWDMTLTVNEHTLIPRADTETLVEWMLTLFPKSTTANFVDLGTGSGAIAIALSREFPHAAITATDVSQHALAVAKQNVQHWQKAPVSFLKTSWLQGFAPQTFDAIISNPPYIDQHDKHLTTLRYEPITALAANRNGLADIETIIQQSLTALKPNGWLLLEHGYQQGKAVREQFQHSGYWQHIQTHQDLSGNDRVTLAQLAAIFSGK